MTDKIKPNKIKYIAYQIIKADNIKEAEKILNDTTDEYEIEIDELDNFFVDHIDCNHLLKGYNLLVKEEMKKLV